MSNLPDLQEWLSSEFELPVVQGITMDECESMLATKINHLINTDFPQLVQILYRVDVDENKLKDVLKEGPDKEAGKVIASMIIERQMQKLNTRRQFEKGAQDIPDEERWEYGGEG